MNANSISETNVAPTQVSRIARITQRIPELDGLRGLAAVAVVMLHAYPDSVFFAGWAGVDLFFVLSGYLITRIVITQGRENGFLKSFYLRRIFRIWPVYYLTLFTLVLINHSSKVGYSLDGLWSHLIFLQNCREYFGLKSLPFISLFIPSWSVAVEEQYYLFWPLLLLWLGNRSIPIFAAGLFTASLVGRCMLPGTYYLLFTRGDGLALGCLLAWTLESSALSTSRPLIQKIFWLAAGVGAIYALSFLTTFWHHRQVEGNWFVTRYTGFSVLFFGLVGISVCYSGCAWLAPLRLPVLRWFGTISYALYLFHMPILSYARLFVARAGVTSELVQTAIMWALMVSLPAASWYLLEQPILRATKWWLAGHALPKATGQEEVAAPAQGS